MWKSTPWLLLTLLAAGCAAPIDSDEPATDLDRDDSSALSGYEEERGEQVSRCGADIGYGKGIFATTAPPRCAWFYLYEGDPPPEHAASAALDPSTPADPEEDTSETDMH